ncbi:hypothetical protein JUN65_02510 [Gluconacetobacter azotocaptans]|uniref:glycoside hydrolase family 66 protein n=1 Tax=Gluconacetobacter azotocaptans TaxID=142834 RepID=UPI0019577700|nr:glycoside hydrolase family 66 protein [Gluconacetobacter azotocaptans]MBM9400467.1 hypothetical protein [Gluconacetobacter azotocaptans]
MRHYLLPAVLSILPSLAAAASLQGPIISHVRDDRAFYQAGNTANVSVELAPSIAWVGGHVDMAVCSRGQVIGAIQSRVVASMAAGADQTLQYPVTVPGLYAHGYQLAIAALNKGDNETASCTGSGSTSASPADVASGGINVAANAWEDINEAWVDAPTVGRVDPSKVMDNLSQYHISAVQFYDVLWRHDEPYSAAPQWPNLEGTIITKANLQTYINAAHDHGMVALGYNLWNGAWADYLTANSKVTAAMGLYALPGRKNQLTNGAGWQSWGWSTDYIAQMNPFNRSWAEWLANQIQETIWNFGFDAAHLDTLGDPGGQQYDGEGHPLPALGTTLADFANYVQARTGAPTDINAVSGWNATDLYLRGLAFNLYIEPHPEFGNTPGYDDSRSLWDVKQKYTSRPLMTAFYPQQVLNGSLGTSFSVNGENVRVCDPTSKSGCMANDPGIELLLGQIALDGGSNITLGDYDHLIPGPYFPRATLGIDGPLQQYLADYYNWWVGMRDLLRVGVISSDERESIRDTNGINIGQPYAQPGTVYYHPLTRAGIAAELALTNMVGLNYNRIDDPDGKNSPIQMNNLSIEMGFWGGRTPGALYYSAPDINHGFPQPLTYTLNGKGSVTFTLPTLKTVALVWLESTSFTTTTDYTIGAAHFVRGGTANFWTNGSGEDATGYRGCCGRSARWDGINFGTGVSTLTMLTRSQMGGPVEFRLDTPDGPVITSDYAPASSSTTTTIQLYKPVTGVHAVIIKILGHDVTLVSWQP